MIFSACAKSAHQSGRDLLDQVLPPDLQNQVDMTVGFSDLKGTPSNYIGRVVMVSVIVLKYKKARDHTEIEILQLPANQAGVPTQNRRRSEGRFLAVQEGLDPATIEAGTPVTVVGEVKGSTTKPLDEGEYVYPVLAIKHIVDWDQVLASGAGSSTYYGSGLHGGYYPYMGMYGPYGYPYYYGPFYPYRFYGGFSSPPPAPPPRGSVPPQFEKGQ
ncbi:MAG: Slp family lipoprotein [Nitrospiraceae bacterium]